MPDNFSLLDGAAMVKYFLTWMRCRFAHRQSELAEIDFRAACDRAAAREERWYAAR